MERLDKILTSQGVCSRKEARELIREGQTTINGVICKKPETKADPEKDEIAVNGKRLSFEKYIYIMMNKPKGVVSATNDKREKTVLDILPEEYRRKGLFPAGRLDKDTEGLLIITDDGDFAHRMLSPSKHVVKQYIAKVDGDITADTVKRFEEGIVFADGTKCKPAVLELPEKENRRVGLVKICEGKFHQVKKMFSCCGINVVQLKRISIGNLYLDSNLHIGACKKLSNLDIEHIFMGNLY